MGNCACVDKKDNEFYDIDDLKTKNTLQPELKKKLQT